MRGGPYMTPVFKRLGIHSEAEAYLVNYVSEHEMLEAISLQHVLTVSGKFCPCVKNC